GPGSRGRLPRRRAAASPADACARGAVRAGHGRHRGQAPRGVVSHDLLAVVLGLGAGLASGLFGVGGGTVFVPVLTLGVGLGQLDAEATSLAAMLPVVVAGAWRQHAGQMVDWRSATVIGGTSVVGVLAGATLATDLGNDTLARAFGVLLLF